MPENFKILDLSKTRDMFYDSTYKRHVYKTFKIFLLCKGEKKQAMVIRYATFWNAIFAFVIVVR